MIQGSPANGSKRELDWDKVNKGGRDPEPIVMLAAL